MNSTYALTVRGYELDSFGHVNNAVYLQYAEAAKWDFFYTTGVIKRMQEQHLFPVVLENNIRYMHELHMQEEVVVDTEWHCSSGLIKYTHLIKKAESGQISCRVTGKLAFVNDERMICDIPEDVRNFIGE